MDRRIVLFFLIALAVLAFTFRERGLSDPGTFWHTRVGELIRSCGLMKTDPFTFTFADKIWIPQQWLGEVIMSFLHDIGGWDAMLFGFLALFAAAFTMVFRRLLAGGMGWPLAGAITALAMVAAGFHLYVRPHLFTIVLMIATTAFIVDVDAQRRKKTHLLWLIPLNILWTNLHGGMLGGLGTLGLAVGCWILRDKKSAAFLLLVLGACGLTMLVNPIGIELQRTWFRLIGSSTLATHIPEHSPLNPARGGDLAVLGFAGLYLLVLMGAGKPKLIWLIPLVWLLLSLQSIRNGPLFVAVASVMLADIWPHTFWYHKLRAGGDTLAVEPAPLTPSWQPVLIMTLFSVTGIIAIHFGLRFVRHDPAFVPLDMVDAVRSVPAGSRIYNDPNLGGFLIWHAPDRKIFMDDRFELCGDSWLDEYVRIVNEEPQRFDDWQKQYGFEWALIAIPEPKALADHLRNHTDWYLVHEGRNALLFRRK